MTASTSRAPSLASTPRALRRAVSSSSSRARVSVTRASREEDADDAESRERLEALRRRSTALLERQRLLTERLERRRREREGEDDAVRASEEAAAVRAREEAEEEEARRRADAEAAAASERARAEREAAEAQAEAQAQAEAEAEARARADAETPKCRERLNIVMVASECAPFSKTGGLGDVMQSLPKALAARGHRVMVVVPRYREYEDVYDTDVRVTFNVLGHPTEIGYFHSYRDGVDYVFVDHGAYHHVRDGIYAGDRSDAMFRNSMLCQAALEAVWHVSCGGAPYGDENLIFVANDWHAALLPIYLQAYYRDHGKFEFARACFVVHNMAHQGRGPLDEFYALQLPEHYKEHFVLDDPVGGECMNVMRAGLRLATKVIAVSEGYAWEITTDMGGWGLAPTIREFGDGKLSGIVNGIDLDEWSPERDAYLDGDGYARFPPRGDAFSDGKRQCKRALQRQLGLAERDDVPVLGFIGRLDDQKGVDLIAEAEGWLCSQDAQLVMLGSGRGDLEDALRGMEDRHRDKCRAWVGFSVEMAHRITAGCDILLMPSRFEPCGLNQLYAMRYGAVPVVHAVGGLRDTVQQYDPFNGTGNGWTFDSAETHKFIDAINHAMRTYREFPEAFREIQARGFERDLGWNRAAELYEDRFIDAKYSW